MVSHQNQVLSKNYNRLYVLLYANSTQYETEQDEKSIDTEKRMSLSHTNTSTARDSRFQIRESNNHFQHNIVVGNG